MSFPRYAEYKDSGVDWLGEVPGHWIVASLKRGFTVKLGKMLQPNNQAPDDELKPYLRAANIQLSGVDTSDVKCMWFSQSELQQLGLQEGDLLISEGGDVGRSAVWRSELDECYFQNSVNRVQGRRDNLTTYLQYWMSTIKNQGYVDVLCNKSTIAHFTAEKVATVPVPFPPGREQSAIAGNCSTRLEQRVS
jgi:type I restriction enzyme, S subunit